MADRQQRSNKETRKPKKDSGGPPKPVSPIAPPPVTAIIERGKKKTK